LLYLKDRTDHSRESSIDSGMINKTPLPDVAMYLQADPQIIMQRERKPDQGLEYLQKKKLQQKLKQNQNLTKLKT
jgi:thymidylate kinase